MCLCDLEMWDCKAFLLGQNLLQYWQWKPQLLICLGKVSFNKLLSLWSEDPLILRPNPSQGKNKKISFHALHGPFYPTICSRSWIKWNHSLASICFAKSALRLLRWSQSKHLNTLSPVSVISRTIFDCTMAENKTQWHSYVTRLQLKSPLQQIIDHTYHSQGIYKVVMPFTS